MTVSPEKQGRVLSAAVVGDRIFLQLKVSGQEPIALLLNAQEADDLCNLLDVLVLVLNRAG